MVDRARKAKYCRQSNVSGDVFGDVVPSRLRSRVRLLGAVGVGVEAQL